MVDPSKTGEVHLKGACCTYVLWQHNFVLLKLPNVERSGDYMSEMSADHVGSSLERSRDRSGDYAPEKSGDNIGRGRLQKGDVG